MANIVPAYPSHPDSSRNYLNSIGNNTQQSIHPTENVPPTTDSTTIRSSPLVPVPPILTASPASSPTQNHTQPTDFSLPLNSPGKTSDPILPSILDSADTGDSFEECMQQQQRCFLVTMAAIQQNLLLAQQAFKTQLQLFIAHRNAMQLSQLPHLSTNSPSHCTLPLAAIQSIPKQNTTNQSIDSLAATWRYPSPLNTQFLLPSGHYNNAATGVPWFKSSLFSLVPFQQRTKVMPLFEI